MTVEIGGSLGPFLDRVQQRQVPVKVLGRAEYRTNGPVANPAEVDGWVRNALYGAVRDVIGRKMDSGELTFRHLGTGDVGAVIPEILAASGLAQRGIAVGDLTLSFYVDGHAPAQAARPQPPPQPLQNNFAAGTFDLGGGQQLRVKIDGKTPENFVKDRASSMVWGWILGAIIIGVVILAFVGIGAYTFFVVKSSDTGGGAAKRGAAAKWDGKSTFECGGNDAVVLSGVTATAGVKASANCHLTLTGVAITAPVGIEADGNAKVTMTGGSITASTSSVAASGNAKVDLVGVKVSGKTKTSGLAKVTGAP